MKSLLKHSILVDDFLLNHNILNLNSSTTNTLLQLPASEYTGLKCVTFQIKNQAHTISASNQRQQNDKWSIHLLNSKILQQEHILQFRSAATPHYTVIGKFFGM